MPVDDAWTSPHKVVLTVKEKKGDCPFYDEGDKIVFQGSELLKEESDNLCMYALSSILPYVSALTRETPSEDWINGKETIQCPDSNRPIIFEISREKQEAEY